MDEDQEMARLGMEDDFVCGYRKRKQRDIQTKEDVLYGVFASAGSDEGGSSRNRRLKSKADFTRPMHFVSVETVMPSESGKKIEEGSNLSIKSKSDLFGSHVGSFEKYTKGIGMKLMEKMGYKGGGLGKDEQGIVAPVEAKLRPKNMGMGFNEYQESKNVPAVKVLEQESDEKQPVVRMKENLCRKDVRARGKKKLEYMTVAEKEESVVIQKIVDMRGPQVRVLTSLENLNAEEKAKGSDFSMRELQHNIRLIMDLTVHERQELGRKLRNEQQMAFALQQKKEKVQKQQLNNMDEIEKVLENVKDESSSGILTLESLIKSFDDLYTRFPDDYKLCDLSSIAFSYALPSFIRTFRGWDPLQNPSYGSNLFLLWKNLLQRDESFDFSGATSSYAHLVLQVVLPAVRRAGINTWQAKKPEPMLRFLEHWEDLLPPSVIQQILDMVVLPKLSEAVDAWDPCREMPKLSDEAVDSSDPCREGISIHAWIYPWLPLLCEKLESLKQAVLIKLGSALRARHPSDSFTILDPWKTVFDTASLERLIVRYILPKLDEIMQDFQVNPADQKLDRFNCVMKWASAIPAHHMVDLLERHFFSKWHQVLHHWLTSQPDFGEVAQWYRGWKDLLPTELAANERIRIQLSKALFKMDRAVDDKPILSSPFKAHKAAGHAQKRCSMGIGVSQMDDQPEMSLIEVIAAYAKEHELLFMPKPGRFHDGLQIHGFGKLSIIVNSPNQMIFAQAGGKWSLVSLDQLLHMQNSSGARRN